MLNSHFAAGNLIGMRKNASGTSGSNLRSIARNRKIGVAGGVVLMATGVWGMLAIGADTLMAIEMGEYTSEASKEFQTNAYVFLFAIVAGLVIFLYAAIPVEKRHVDPSWKLRER